MFSMIAADLQDFSNSSNSRVRSLVNEAESILSTLELEESSLRALLRDLDKSRDAAEQAAIEKVRIPKHEKGITI